MDPETQRKSMRCTYERALCCLRHHPEIWTAYAKYELGPAVPLMSTGARVDKAAPSRATPSTIEPSRIAKSILKEGIECNKNSCLLRFALAELEEEMGCMDDVLVTLREAVSEIPCGLTFSVYERFVRRTQGITSARRCLSETIELRADGSFNHEVC